MGLNLEKELAFYRKYHYNNTNVLIHIIFVPLILLTTQAMTTRVKVPLEVLTQVDAIPPYAYSYINLGLALAIAYGIYYTLLDVVYGLPSIPLLIFSGVKLTNLLDIYGAPALKVMCVGFVVSWIIQFIGHGVFEKRAPALLDNIVQALVLAPFFVVFEIGYFFGFRRNIIDNVDKIIKPELEAFHKTKVQ